MDFERPKSESEQGLSPVLQEIVEMNLNCSEDEFQEKARTDPESREVSEDAFLQMAKKLVEGEEPSPNTWGAMLRILERNSMQDSSRLELFQEAVRELAEKFDYEIREGDGEPEEKLEG